MGNEEQNSLANLEGSPRPALRTGLSREAFLRRCETIFDAGLASPDALRLLDTWLDFVMRLEGGQTNYWVEFLEDERERLGHFGNGKTLANDQLGYKLIQLSAILNHHCQLCAEDLNAWWTRGAFCEHRKQAASGF